jgi:mannose-6-phosphate isomerase
MGASVDNFNLKRPVLLAPDNFTDCQQTPWAGESIAKYYKAALFAKTSGVKIGESWEFSCDPNFPSRLQEINCSLPEMVRRFPEEILSPHQARKFAVPSCEILVKLLNSAVPLSFQVHPEDGDSSLSADECGKPESWLILKAEPGAGVYLGFSRPISLDFLRSILMSGKDLRPFLNFVPVRPGDYFEIQPGIPHAVGGGITMLEPQRILPGKSGKTYRIWDWGRRYDKQGKPTRDGVPRKLHIKEGLRIIDPMTQVGSKFSETCRRTGRVFRTGVGVAMTEFPNNGFYQVRRFVFTPGGTIDLDIDQGYAALTCLSGEIVFVAKGQENTCITQGSSALIPFSALPMTLSSRKDSDIVLVVPDQATLKTS